MRMNTTARRRREVIRCLRFSSSSREQVYPAPPSAILMVPSDLASRFEPQPYRIVSSTASRLYCQASDLAIRRLVPGLESLNVTGDHRVGPELNLRTMLRQI